MILTVLIAASAAAPELEVQAGGMTETNQEGDSGRAFAVRGGVDFADRFALSLRFAQVAGGNPIFYVSDGDPRDPAGFSGWQALLEARVHTRGLLQWHAAAAAGVARLLTYQCSCSESYALHGKAAFATRLSGGASLHPAAVPGLSFGLELDWSTFRGLQAPPPGANFQAFYGRHGVSTAGLTGTLGYRF